MPFSRAHGGGLHRAARVFALAALTQAVRLRPSPGRVEPRSPAGPVPMLAAAQVLPSPIHEPLVILYLVLAYNPIGFVFSCDRFILTEDLERGLFYASKMFDKMTELNGALMVMQCIYTKVKVKETMEKAFWDVVAAGPSPGNVVKEMLSSGGIQVSNGVIDTIKHAFGGSPRTVCKKGSVYNLDNILRTYDPLVLAKSTVEIMTQFDEFGVLAAHYTP